MNKFVAGLFFLMAAFTSILAFYLSSFLQGGSLILAFVLVTFGITLWTIGTESESDQNRNEKISFAERILRFFGRLICGVVLGFPFLGFGMLSAIPYGGGNKGFFVLFDFVLFGGVVWAFIGLFESGVSIQSNLTPETTSTTSKAVFSGAEINCDRIEKTNVSESNFNEKTADAPIELVPILDSVDIRKFVKIASERQIHLVNSDRSVVSPFFNAIRYGKIDRVRKLLSSNPLLVLTKDAYGNTPLEAAVQENCIELQNFFKECLR